MEEEFWWDLLEQKEVEEGNQGGHEMIRKEVNNWKGADDGWFELHATMQPCYQHSIR